MPKLWDKGYQLDREVERFTVGEDYRLDEVLVEADVLGSIAHARMLQAIGILSRGEFRRLKAELVRVLKDAAGGRFKIRRRDEDVHTAVENRLTKRLGRLGKKLHTARSRNDQVLLDLRLYMREEVLEVKAAAIDLAQVLVKFAHRHRGVPIPGRTHTQRAMPSSVGLWAGAFAESLLDDLALLDSAYELVNQCPLGSAASYGVAVPIDRQLVSDLLGFAKVQNNVLYANNSRGKFEAVVLFALTTMMHDVAKLSGDLILFSIPEFGYFELPEQFCPGSSIMPQKRNPGPLEAVRAFAASVEAGLVEVLGIIAKLPSGYNRDFQYTKGPLMRGFELTSSSLGMLARIFAEIKVNKKRCIDAFTPELFAADEALRLAEEGMPFRDAYRQVASDLELLAAQDPVANIRAKTHMGAPGNLGLDLARTRIRQARKALRAETRRLGRVQERLLDL
jgi:argininosuccinate lyase